MSYSHEVASTLPRYKMRINLPAELTEIEDDCLKLQSKKQLTEFGKGELRIIRKIRQLEETRLEEIWNIMNTFRTKLFLTEPKAEIDVGDFDNLMNDVREVCGLGFWKDRHAAKIVKVAS